MHSRRAQAVPQEVCCCPRAASTQGSRIPGTCTSQRAGHEVMRSRRSQAVPQKPGAVPQHVQHQDGRKQRGLDAQHHQRGAGDQDPDVEPGVAGQLVRPAGADKIDQLNWDQGRLVRPTIWIDRLSAAVVPSHCGTHQQSSCRTGVCDTENTAMRRESERCPCRERCLWHEHSGAGPCQATCSRRVERLTLGTALLAVPSLESSCGSRSRCSHT